MGEIRILTETDLRSIVGLGEDERTAVARVFPLIASGDASMPPIMRIDVPEHNGEIDIKSAYLPGYAGIAVKVSAGFFDNPAVGLPSLGGLMMVLDSTTGVPMAALFDNGYLTDLRTGLAGAVAADHCSNRDAASVCVFGAGVQAEYQLRAVTTVRPIDRASVWARDSGKASSFALRMSESLGIPISAVADPVVAANSADILVTTTPSTTPLVTSEMVHPGLHVTAVGSDAETKQEISDSVVSQASLVVCDSIPQSMRLGELRSPVEHGFDPRGVIELGDIVGGKRAARGSDRDVTICDLTGTGAQDTAIASLAMARAADRDLGISVAV